MYCENEFGVATETKAGSAGFIAERLQNMIISEKQHCDHIIVIFHGGNEHNPLPSPKVIERYHFLINEGASAVIAMHPHCLQGYEYINKGGYIVYSLGNFFFPKSKKVDPSSRWYIGYVAHLELSKINIKLTITPYRYSNLNNLIIPMANKNLDICLNYIDKLNQIIANKNEIKLYFAAWCLFRARNYVKYFNTQNGIYNMKQCLEIQNLFRCEAHRELMQNYFELLHNGNNKLVDDYLQKLKQLMFIPLDIENFEKEISALYRPSIKFDEIQILNLTKGKNIYICGAGNFGVDICQFLLKNKVNILKFLDNDKFKIGDRIFGLEVLPYEHLIDNFTDNETFVIAINSKEAKETIYKQLINIGICEKNIISAIN